MTFKEAEPKKYQSFKITQDIGQEVFQLKLLKEWVIYNVFNEDLLTQYRESQFKGQYIEMVPLLDIINEKEEYEVEKVQNHRKQGYGIQFLIYQKDYGNEYD